MMGKGLVLASQSEHDLWCQKKFEYWNLQFLSPPDIYLVLETDIFSPIYDIYKSIAGYESHTPLLCNDVISDT